jgi:rRNA biogenesis protein RRP5
VVDKDYVPLTTIAELKEGQTITGKVRKVEEFGAFIDIAGTMNLSGLCHRSEMADRTVKDARTLYNEGDRVKARVLKVDVEKKRINLGLKPSYFKDGEADDMDVDSDDEDAGAVLDGEDESEDEVMSDAGGAILIGGSDDEEEDEDEEDGGDVEMGEAEGLTGLDAGGFDWTANALDADDNAGIDVPSKKAKKRREPQGIVDKTAELDINGPQTSSDYERLLLGQPDSSELWIAYMASQMQVNDMASARQVAERAIKTIGIKEETEKLNVWIAYLNLEVAYGTDETVEEVFKRACTYNDDLEIHERLASIYIQSNKHKASSFPPPT